MTSSTSAYIYWLMAACFAGGAVVVVLNFPALVRTLKPSRAVHLAALAALIIIGGWMRLHEVPREFVKFHDEYDLYNSAAMIARNADVRWCMAGTFDDCESIETPFTFFGYPFLWAGAMKVSGDFGPAPGFWLNGILGTISIFAVYLLVMAAAGRPGAALAASFLAAFMPLGLRLSGNASFETASFLFLALFFTFVMIFMREKTALAAAAVFFLAMAAVLVRSMNAMAVPLVIAVFLYYKTLRIREWIVAGAAVAAMAALLLPLAPVALQHLGTNGAFFDRFSQGHLGVLAGNLKFLAANDYFPPVFVVLSVLGLAMGRGKMGQGAWLPLFSLMVFFIISMIRLEVWQGDFPTRIYTMTLPLLILGGVGVEELLLKINGRVMKFIAAAVIAACAVAGNKAAFAPLVPIFNVQDKLMAQYLPDTDPSCSIFAVEPSLVMAHDSNRKVYRLDKLYDGEFMEKHGECKILVVDFHLATNTADQIVTGMDRRTPRYRADELEKLREQFSFNPRHQVRGIFGVFDFEIVYITPTSR